MRRKQPLTTAIWYDAALGPAELLKGTYTDFSYDPHAHDAACFSIITRGSIRIRVRGREFMARPGDMFAVDTGEVHAGWPIDDKGWSLRTMYVPLERLDDLVSEKRSGPFSSRIFGPMIRDGALAESFLQLHRCSEAGRAPVEREERLFTFARTWLERCAADAAMTPAGSEPLAVRRAKDFLEAHFDQRVSLAEVADAARLPRFQLLRAFVRSEGVSPHTYQRHARLRSAIEAIRNGSPLSEAAAAAGFADQAHLTRIFRGAMGITPGAYQRAIGQSRGVSPSA